jgi:hypothetical protein
VLVELRVVICAAMQLIGGKLHLQGNDGVECPEEVGTSR